MAVRPVPHRITQNFGVRNSAYRLGYHPGTDYGSPTGTAVKATEAGYVRYYGGYNGGYGNMAVLALKNGDTVVHCHLQKPGRTGNVAKGAVIGYTNNTGWSTGPHLHVEYRIGGSINRPIDFEKWLKAHPETAPKPKPRFPRAVTVTGPANVRSKPNTSAPLSGSRTLKKGDVFTSAGLVTGTNVGGNNKWHKSSKGNYVWSGNTNVRS